MTLGKVGLKEFEKQVDKTMEKINISDLACRNSSKKPFWGRVDYEQEFRQATIKMCLELAKGVSGALIAKSIAGELSHKDRVTYEELDRLIKTRAPSELVKETKKGVIQYMVYEEETRTHVIMEFPKFKGLHRIGASTLDIV